MVGEARGGDRVPILGSIISTNGDMDAELKHKPGKGEKIMGVT